MLDNLSQTSEGSVPGLTSHQKHATQKGTMLLALATLKLAVEVNQGSSMPSDSWSPDDTYRGS